MTLTELRYIVAVARERHFGRAAERCFVSQPTLSVAIRKLEEELSIMLFERGRSDVRVTPVGRQIVEQAQRVLEEAARIKQIARHGQDELRGPLRLGLIYTVGPYLLPDLIPILRKRAPQMPLVVEENFTANLRERLKHGELDVIIISLPFNEPGVLTQPLYDDPFVLVLPAAHPLGQKKTIEIDALRHENVLLLGAGHCFREQVLSACPTCQPSDDGDSQQTLEGSSLETIRHMVASGMGITILPCTAAGADKYARRLLAIRQFAGATPRRRVALAWRASFPRPKAIAAVHQAVLACPLTCIKMLHHVAARLTESCVDFLKQNNGLYFRCTSALRSTYRCQSIGYS